MAIVEFFVDNGANIHSKKKSGKIDTKRLGLDDGEWEKLSDDEKQEYAQSWANEHIEVWWEEE